MTITGIVTTLRVRQTRKGEEMAWLCITDSSGAAEMWALPHGLPAAGQPTLLREGAFLVAKGRVAHEETTGTKVWIDQLVIHGKNSQLEAVRILTHASGGHSCRVTR